MLRNLEELDEFNLQNSTLPSLETTEKSNCEYCYYRDVCKFNFTKDLVQKILNNNVELLNKKLEFNRKKETSTI